MAADDNLVRYDPAVPRNSFATIIPKLATAWECNARKAELTFKLRSDVRWHDKPFTSRDAMQRRLRRRQVEGHLIVTVEGHLVCSYQMRRIAVLVGCLAVEPVFNNVWLDTRQATQAHSSLVNGAEACQNCADAVRRRGYSATRRWEPS